MILAFQFSLIFAVFVALSTKFVALSKKTVALSKRVLKRKSHERATFTVKKCKSFVCMLMLLLALAASVHFHTTCLSLSLKLGSHDRTLGLFVGVMEDMSNVSYGYIRSTWSLLK